MKDSATSERVSLIRAGCKPELSPDRTTLAHKCLKSQ